MIGRLNAKVAPFPSELFSAHIFPPWVSIMLFEINKPSPVPLEDFETNFSNSLDNMLESIPKPVSLMLTMTTSLLLLLLSFFFSTTIDIVPSSFVNLIALSNRLEITWLSLILSASIMISSLVASLYNILLLLLLSSSPYSRSQLLQT